MAAPSPTDLVVLCHSEPTTATGNWRLFASSDGGLTFQNRGTIGGNRRVQLIGAPTPDDIAIAADDTDGYSWILTSHDGGRSWARTYQSPYYGSTDYGALGNAGFTSATVGYVLETKSGAEPSGSATEDRHLLVTRDGGKTWTRVSFASPPNK
ncbi:WD40/YVTN/BNR-like repeat-containing protein [Nocardia sp. NPDC088792]|uniref:WD40/YVTN/BNR-like repeat-containing protein n=1 Tax=Nocardia sp. NPDC088792 TaxID=3364332 RepID=UPI00381BB780